MSCASNQHGETYEGGDVSSPYLGGDEIYNGGDVSGGYIASGLYDYNITEWKGWKGRLSSGISVVYFIFYIIVMVVLIFHPDATKFRVVGGFMLVFLVLWVGRLIFLPKQKENNSSN